MKIKFLIFIIASFFITSCNNTYSCYGDFNQQIPDEKILASLPIEKYIDSIASEIYPRYGGGNIVVTDFIDTTTYQATPTGVIMAEMLKASISHKTTARVLQLDFRKSFNLDSNGLTALTRDVKKIMKNRSGSSIALVGSYNIINNVMYIFVKRINIRSGTIVYSATRKIKFSCLGDYVIDTTIREKSINRNVFTP